MRISSFHFLHRTRAYLAILRSRAGKQTEHRYRKHVHRMHLGQIDAPISNCRLLREQSDGRRFEEAAC